MRLGLSLGYSGDDADVGHAALAQEAERLGYAVCWAAEAYGSDAPTVLAWIAARTERIEIGAAVMQIPARTPAMTAMTAATLDALSGGRFRLGLGVSGPQVCEGWHGVRFDRPLERTREYVEIVRMVLRRETLRFEGAHWQLPLPDGPGKAIKLSSRPLRSDLPIYLAAVGPRNSQLAGEIADGWLGMFFAPEQADAALAPIIAGRRLRGAPIGSAKNSLDGFDVAVTVPVVIQDDVEAAADHVRGYAALYLGGMGSRDQNFYNALACRLGYEQEARHVQELYLGGQHRAAANAVPRDFIDATSLIGPPARVRDRLQAYRDAGVTTLNVSPFAANASQRLGTLRAMAEAFDAADVAS